ncbi:MAG: transcriptional regulator [Candidatus Scalindua sp. AMX11]|nr:MAG: transcriptional regulator [Candidatus Scalindua sp.]NOG83012.1 metal-dependent transcriptional regulator [Planctomycetota bacterium]RZV79586.1 MAG: transcriptional regulator [Candidatus Scalindua sp. SCAELEC01]TDE65227.1 MAG: transcriptional regulator [Candidatus Scalindua sp. AMX11]GJQ58536.1 MAG: transcriptional regulator [Candidatus Scalindua sp.]
MSDEIQIEEFLEYIWIAEEDHGIVKQIYLEDKFGSALAEKFLGMMDKRELIDLDKNEIVLTKTGRGQAQRIIRRHRIAERLMNDVLEIGDDVLESGACQFEHFVNEEIIASICTLLGHPVVCPHGKKIPPGECCFGAKKALEAVVSPLSKLKAGERAKVAYITTRSHSSLDRLSSIGVIPGLVLTVHQKYPSIVIQFGETQLALDKDIANNVYVRKMSI